MLWLAACRMHRRQLQECLNGLSSGDLSISPWQANWHRSIRLIMGIDACHPPQLARIECDGILDLRPPHERKGSCACEHYVEQNQVIPPEESRERREGQLRGLD
jgi:hypothetical protein